MTSQPHPPPLPPPQAPFCDGEFTTDVSEREDSGVEVQNHLDACQMALCAMMHSWPGLIYLAASPRGLRSITELLRDQDVDTQVGHRGGGSLCYLYGSTNIMPPPPPAFQVIDELLKLLFMVFRLNKPVWSPSFAVALQSISRSKTLRNEHVDPRVLNCPDLLDNYLAATLLAFVDAGLPETLVQV